MADPQNTEAPVSFDDAFKSFNRPTSADAASRLRVYIHPKEPQNTDKPQAFDDVFKQFEANKVPEAPVPDDKTIFEKGAISDENQKMADVQFTNQTPKKEDYIGPAVPGKEVAGDEKDDSFYLRDEKDNYQQLDKNKHIVFKDPETGDYGAYKRDPDQDRGAITGRLVGLGHLMQNATFAPTRLPSTIGTLTRGQTALRAAGAIEDTTGVHVPVPQNAVTESAISPKVSTALQALPGGDAPFAQAEHGMATGLSNARDAAAGPAANVERAGETAREAFEAQGKPKGILAQRVGAAYDKLDAHMPSDASGDLANTRKVAQDIQDKFEATRGESGTNKIDPTINEVLSAVTDPKGVSYSGLKDLRTRVGEMLEGGSTIKDTGISDKQLKGLYKGLTDDTRAMVAEHGGDRGLSLWERANTAARAASDRRESLGRILGTGRSDEGIFNRLVTLAGTGSTADAKTLALAKKSMPADQWGEIAEAAAGRLGNIKTDQGIRFDPGQFVKDYSKLSDRGKAVLFGENQRLRKALDSISDLAKYEPKVSHPGPLMHLAATGVALGHGERGEGLVGKVGNALHILGGVVSMRVLGKMLTKPATAESVAKWMQGYKLMTLKPTQGNVTMVNRLSEALSNDAASIDREKIGNALRAAGDYAERLMIKYSPFGEKQ